MDEVLSEHLHDERMPAEMFEPLTAEWQSSIRWYHATALAL